MRIPLYAARSLDDVLFHTWDIRIGDSSDFGAADDASLVQPPCQRRLESGDCFTDYLIMFGCLRAVAGF
jgi:hypothetical protein